MSTDPARGLGPADLESVDHGSLLTLNKKCIDSPPPSPAVLMHHRRKILHFASITLVLLETEVDHEGKGRRLGGEIVGSIKDRKSKVLFGGGHGAVGLLDPPLLWVRISAVDQKLRNASTSGTMQAQLKCIWWKCLSFSYILQLRNPFARLCSLSLQWMCF